MYPVSNSDFLLAQTGGELYGNVPLGAAGTLEYRLYGGTVFYDTADATSTATNVTVPYIVGGRLMWQTPIEGLQAGGSVQKLRLDGDVNLPAALVTALTMTGGLPANFANPLPIKIPALLGVASLEYNAHNLLLASEYSRWRVSLESPVPMFSTPNTQSERFYVMFAYHVTRWFYAWTLLFVVVRQRRRDRSGKNTAVACRPDHRPRTCRVPARCRTDHEIRPHPYWLPKVGGPSACTAARPARRLHLREPATLRAHEGLGRPAQQDHGLLLSGRC